MAAFGRLRHDAGNRLDAVVRTLYHAVIIRQYDVGSNHYLRARSSREDL